ncbi:hypothetical protein F4861DRAFT_188264 [Xylaria intraflava]|nr:hypothetical protein F4861DRAFT_188264 [Xylaria intraflava]
MTLPEIPGIQRLPYELMAYIVRHLGVEDVFHWSLCSKHFQYMIREDRFCKPVITSKAADTLEARDALETGVYSRALRRLAKRRNALSQASPYVAGIVAYADSYGFFNGKLCYIIGLRPPRWLRILEIHKSTGWELVVDIPTLICAAVPRAASCHKYRFRVLYEAAGIVSCLFTFALNETENWLLIIRPQEQRVLEAFRLESTARIFVRNNEKFLYFGTHSGDGNDGLRKWVIKGFDLSNLSWLPQPRMYLSNVAGYEIGLTVCFEIFGDHFYGLSNRILFEADDPEWRSYYYCFRFPLNEPCVDKTQVMRKEDSWRRQHSEGPIDERWGFLSLEIDETDGNIVILECRKEWLGGQSGSRRTYYTTEVVFHQQPGQDYQRSVRTNTTRRPGDHPNCDAPVLVRPPRHVHAGDDSSVALLLLRSKAHFCAYIRCCHTFLDLIDDSNEDTSPLRRLRLRTGYRRLGPGTELMSEKPTRHTPWSPGELSNVEPPTLSPQTNTIFIWPPEQDSLKPDLSLDRVQELLNVDGRRSCVTATGDERSVIYATDDSKTGSKALVFVSFDPAVRLEGMERGGHVLGQQISHDGSPKRTEPASDGFGGLHGMLQFRPNVPLGAAEKVIRSDAGKVISMPSLDPASASSPDLCPPSPLPAPEGTDGWARYEKAMHLTIQRSLFFGR